MSHNKYIIKAAIWPQVIKSDAEVVPVYKFSKNYLTTNYRPISLISNIAKIFEKIIYTII